MKRKFACGFALCLALAVAGCGKGSKEQQAVNYYQDELGLDKEEAEELAHELYGEDEDEPSVTESPKETVVEPLPELVNSEWYEQKVQIYDMVFDNYMYMTEEDIRKIVEESASNVELLEDFDKNGDIRLGGLWLDAQHADQLWGKNCDSSTNAVKYGVVNEGYYYEVRYWSLPFYDKASIEFKDFKTRDDVLAYLSENGFVEVEEEQAPYAVYSRQSLSGAEYAEFLDVPHYYCKGAQSITFFRVHKLGETDQVTENSGHHYSGAHLNLVNAVTFTFNTDGTIDGDANATQELVIGLIELVPIPCLIFLFPLRIVRNVIFRTYRILQAKKTLKTCVNVLPQAEALLWDAWKSIAPHVDKIPRDYRNSDALAFFSNSFFNYKVRNLPEAVNLYDQHLHQQRMEKSQREML